MTGFGFAAQTSATANDATLIAVSFTYLGADEAVGGGDDVSIGTATGSYNFTVGREYVFSFVAPLTADLGITDTRFRIQIAPSNPAGNGSLKLKTGALASEPSSTSAKLSVAGFTSSLINPQRVNLAKFQPVIPGSVSGQRLASYVTDGVTGNDNRWQSENWAWNTARVDFPFPVEVGSAQVFTGVDDGLAVGNFSVQYLNGSTWMTIPGGGVTGNTNVERNLALGPVILLPSAGSFPTSKACALSYPEPGLIFLPMEINLTFPSIMFPRWGEIPLQNSARMPVARNHHRSPFPPVAKRPGQRLDLQSRRCRLPRNGVPLPRNSATRGFRRPLRSLRA